MNKKKFFLPILAASSMFFAGVSLAEDTKTEVDHTAQCINDALNVLGTSHTGQFENYRRSFSAQHIEAGAFFTFDTAEGVTLEASDSDEAVKGLVGIYAFIEGIVTIPAGATDVSGKDIAVVSAFAGSSCGAFSYSAIYCVLSENALPFDINQSASSLNFQTMGRQCYICSQHRSTILSTYSSGASVSFLELPGTVVSVPQISSTTSNDHFTKAQVSDVPNYFNLAVNPDVCAAIAGSSISLFNVEI
jgi:hypothetical protein